MTDALESDRSRQLFQEPPSCQAHLIAWPCRFMYSADECSEHMAGFASWGRRGERAGISGEHVLPFQIIEDTDRLTQAKGISQFLQQPVRSIFVDGELAMMMGARRLVAEHEPFRERMRELVHITADRMAVGPVLSCESYPNECWTFCNTVALAAIRMHEVLDGEDHRQLRRDWIATAKDKLVHQQTGLLCSSYTYDGQAMVMLSRRWPDETSATVQGTSPKGSGLAT